MSEESDHMVENESVTYEVRVRLSAYESDLIDELAERSGLSLGELLRRALRAYADTEPHARAVAETSAMFHELRRYLVEPHASNDADAIHA